MRIKFDPAADSIYITLETGCANPVGETDVGDTGVIIDRDVAGVPRGYELLMVSSVEPLGHQLPPDVTTNLKQFVRSGALHSPEPVEWSSND
jgi:uncharacterized protein YuzE